MAWSYRPRYRGGHRLGKQFTALLLVLLAIAGLFFMQKNELFFLEKDVDLIEKTPGLWRRAEFWLCLWLALAIGAQNLLAHPTFPMYFVFMIPFLTVLAVLGFCGVVERLGTPGGPGAAVTVLVCCDGRVPE